jgi:hypothetical protein
MMSRAARRRTSAGVVAPCKTTNVFAASRAAAMSRKWEYPWYAAWDLAFHTIPLACVDPAFAKEQLVLFLREWYMHPNGQMPAYEWSLRGLLVAAPWGGSLRYVANVRTGFSDQERRRWPALLAGRGRTRPLVPCPHQGLWVEPELLCQVHYLEWTPAGRLRGASFHRVVPTP